MWLGGRNTEASPPASRLRWAQFFLTSRLSPEPIAVKNETQPNF